MHVCTLSYSSDGREIVRGLLWNACLQSRIQSYMGRVKEIQDKHLSPRLNVDTSKRFVRNALWSAAQKLSPSLSPSTSAVKSTCFHILFWLMTFTHY